MGKEKIPPGAWIALVNDLPEDLLTLLHREVGSPLCVLPKKKDDQASVSQLANGWIVTPDPRARLSSPSSDLVSWLRMGRSLLVVLESPWTPGSLVGGIPPWIEELLGQVPVPLVPLWVDWFWAKIWERLLPSSLLPSSSSAVRIYAGSPIFPEPSPAQTMDTLRKELYDLSERALSSRPELESNVVLAVLSAAKRNPNEEVFWDSVALRGIGRKKLWIVALSLASWLRAVVREERVGIVLPPGIGSAIANLACLLAGKSALNCNFTAGPRFNRFALEQAQVKVVVTAETLRKRYPDFPWPERTFDLKDVLRRQNWFRMGVWAIAHRCLPLRALVEVLGIPREGGNREALLLYTTGTSGDPKGVILSHRNLLANLAQIEALLGDLRLKKMMASLPVFHSFGATVTLWWPLAGGPRAVSHPSPWEANRIAELIHQHQIDVLFTTPTFLRGFLRGVPPQQLVPLQIVITGAERLPSELATEFWERFHVPVCQGYGMTEASPVVSAAFVDFRHPLHCTRQTRTYREGSVGRLVPGLSLRIRHPETKEELPLDRPGLLYLKGPNLTSGYLGDPERTQQAFEEGWYCTGDIGRLDPEGFLFIEDRANRFSKIGGEMVPHATVEEGLQKLLSHSHEQNDLVIIGVPDLTRGERLIALTTKQFSLPDIRTGWRQLGLPLLWLPKEVHQVEEIPRTPLGKPDLKACQKLAIQLSRKSRAKEEEAG